MGDPEIVMVHSYKGGSGKTLFSTNLATQMADQRRVLLIEGDLQGPVYAKIFPDIRPDLFLNGYLKSDEIPLDSYVYGTKAGFDLIFASPKFTLDDLIAPADYEELLGKIRAVKRDLRRLDYDLIIIDLAPGVNYFAVASIVLADRIMMILRPDQNAFEGVKTLLEVVYLNTVRKDRKQFHLVWSQIPEHEGFENMISDWDAYLRMNYPFISSSHQLPFEPETSYNFVQHSLILPRDDPTAVRIADMAREVIRD